MEVIVTHTNADFDALASLVAGSILYPDAWLVIPGSCEHNVEEFLNTYQHNIPLVKSRSIPLKKITKLIIVDTRQPTRIGKFKDILHTDVPIHIYDHHPAQPNDITGEVEVIKHTGATTTILLERIIERNISITPTHATIFALGIYEDTGSLTFSTTTPEDLSTVATLLKNQADLKIVSDFIRKELTPTQIIIMSELLKSQKVYLVHGRIVLITKAVVEEYVGDLSVIVHKIMNIQTPDALFCLFKMDERIWLIGRSKVRMIDVGKILTKVGGGHPTAGSGIVKGLSIDKVEELLLKEIEGITGAILKPLPTIHILSRKGFPQYRYIGSLMKTLPYTIQSLLHEIGKIGDMLGYNVYVVGGFVRDLLLKKENFDIDIVVEGDGIHFAKEFTDKIGGTCKLHHRFKTAVITFPDGFKIDIATARKEQYEHPAALPKIETSAIVEDLFRRDFTINAMAIQINESSYGNLVDFFGGEQDIKDKSIKVLHTKSFIDDPTRIFRAVRFETRLGFKIHPLTKELILEALVNEPLFERLANQRVRDELILILNDENPQIAIQRLSELGVLKYIHPTITITKGLLELFKKVTEGFFYFEVIISQQKVERWLSYFIALVDNLKVKHVEEIATHLKFTNIQRNKLINGKKTADRVVNYLRLKPELNPSDVYKLLNKIPIEVLIFIVAKSEAVFQTGLSCKIKKAVADYLSYMREEKVLITGDDLKQLGLPPGPMYKDIIMDVLYARLDKKVITKEDEIAWVKQKWQDKINKQIDH